MSESRPNRSHRLAPCPESPNCVSTEAEDGKRMEAIPFPARRSSP